MARFLSGVRTRRSYRELHRSSEQLFGRLGAPARALYRGVRGGTHGFLSRFTNNEALYSNLDIKYIGPVDGHDIGAIEQAKNYGAPAIVHVIAQKGKGYEPALHDAADRFHAVGQIDPATGGSAQAGREVPGARVRRRYRETAAVASAAGLAFGGLHPVVALYATFISRAFGQVLTDVALHKAGVTFVLDRAGVTGPDGPSHHGM